MDRLDMVILLIGLLIPLSWVAEYFTAKASRAKPEPVLGEYEVIVCADHARASALRRKVPQSAKTIIIWPATALISGISPRRVIVAPDVNLDQDVGGEGRLEDLLRQRQRLWGDKAVFIDLGAVGGTLV